MKSSAIESYSRTSHKRLPIMSRICGRLREVVAYQRSDRRGSKISGNLHMVIGLITVFDAILTSRQTGLK